MTDNQDSVEFTTKTFKNLLMYNSLRVKRSDMDDIVVTKDYDIEFDTIRYTIEKFCVADNLAHDVYDIDMIFTSPSTTWQMFKQTHAESWWLGWLVRRRPVKNTQEVRTAFVEVDRYLVYPEAKAKSPASLGRVIAVDVVKNAGVVPSEEKD